MKKVWERRSYAFPPHYTPGYGTRRRPIRHLANQANLAAE